MNLTTIGATAVEYAHTLIAKGERGRGTLDQWQVWSDLKDKVREYDREQAIVRFAESHVYDPLTGHFRKVVSWTTSAYTALEDA